MSKKPILDDAVRRLLQAEMDKRGLDFKALSKLLGKNDAYVQQFMKRGSPPSLPEDVRSILSGLWGIPEARFKGAARTPPPRPQADRILGPVSLGQPGANIPVFGQAVGGNDGRFILNGNKIADVLAPPALLTVRDAYAVYVAGTSMVPRYLPGETVYVHPHLPVRAGDYVVVQLNPTEDGEPIAGYIKEFVSRDSKRLKLRQLNPRKIITFPDNAVGAVHRIVLGG